MDKFLTLDFPSLLYPPPSTVEGGGQPQGPFRPCGEEEEEGEEEQEKLFPLPMDGNRTAILGTALTQVT